ncbi:MAG: hypothetical protein BJ554DRAFT_4781 [Olpidium bornovanus]|uniref:Phosphatidylethanolamine-binding protein n=1 Tax=Olpidium bornovanus TaxID=278681 RepID=A0A8H7ZLJ3_9FUNG|nr:MAG: hypothetical protein BJ554DRAFT_4781 [Olpidium bornovanus]
MLPDVRENLDSTDIPIGMFTCEFGPLPSDAGNTVLPYIPPHPQRGTKPHRYTLLLMEQPREIGADILKYDAVDVDSTTRAIELTPLIKRNKLIIRGATGFRSQWDESVYGIYKTILGEDFEPVYGVITEPPATGPNGLPLSMFANA